MTTFLPFWIGLSKEFSTAGAILGLIDAGVFAALVFLLLTTTYRLVRNRIRRLRVARELRLVHDAAYKERPKGNANVA